MKYSTTLRHFGERQQELLRILLKNREGRTIEELSGELQITRTAVKQHLNALNKAGYVALGQLRQAFGRPSRVWVITPSGSDLFPRQYSWFSAELLKNLKAAAGSEALVHSLRAIASGVADSIRERVQGPSLEHKVQAVSEIMTELGYEASAVPGEGAAPAIEAFNCVYHSLAEAHPEVCQFDIELLTRLTSAEVTQCECMVRGGSCCRFIFKSQGKEPQG